MKGITTRAEDIHTCVNGIPTCVKGIHTCVDGIHTRVNRHRSGAVREGTRDVMGYHRKHRCMHRGRAAMSPMTRMKARDRCLDGTLASRRLIRRRPAASAESKDVRTRREYGGCEASRGWRVNTRSARAAPHPSPLPEGERGLSCASLWRYLRTCENQSPLPSGERARVRGGSRTGET